MECSVCCGQCPISWPSWWSGEFQGRMHEHNVLSTSFSGWLAGLQHGVVGRACFLSFNIRNLFVSPCFCAVVFALFFFFLKHYQMLLQLQTYCVAEQCVFSACRCSRQNFIHDLFTGCCRVSGFRMVSWIPKKETRLGNYFLSWYTSQEHRPAPQSHPSDFKPMSLRSWKQPIVSR